MADFSFSRGLKNRGTAARGIQGRGTGTPYRSTGFESFPATGMHGKKRPDLVIYFKKDNDTLQSGEKSKLDRLANILIAEPFSFAHVVGHASSEGDPSYNYNLSERRVNAVVMHLVNKKKVAQDQLKSKAVGTAQPAVEENGDETKRALNRRVEITLERKKPDACLPSKDMRIIERTIQKKREAVSKLTNRVNEFKRKLNVLRKRVESGVVGLSGAILVELQQHIDDRENRIEMHQRHLYELEAAIRDGACSDRFIKLEKRRIREIGDDFRIYDKQLQDLHNRLLEMQNKQDKATGDQKRFYGEAIEFIIADIKALQEEKDDLKKQQAREKELERRQEQSRKELEKRSE